MHAAFTLDALNDMRPGEFVTALGDIFEHAPWVAEFAYQRRPFATVTALHQAMLAGLAAASAWEQAIAGLDALTQEDTARLARWNAQYRERFGFPFIICARRHTHSSIFAEFERRLAGEPEAERRAALVEIARISALRLVD